MSGLYSVPEVVGILPSECHGHILIGETGRGIRDVRVPVRRRRAPSFRVMRGVSERAQALVEAIKRSQVCPLMARERADTPTSKPSGRSPVHPLVPVAPGVQQPQVGVRLRIVPAPHAAADDGLRVVDVDLVPGASPEPRHRRDGPQRTREGDRREHIRDGQDFDAAGIPRLPRFAWSRHRDPQLGCVGRTRQAADGMKQMSVAPGPYGHPSTPGLTSLLTVSRTGDYVPDTANA